MADGVARVVVEADTSLADAAFKKLRADAERAMDAIGRQRAQAEVDAKTTGFDRKIDNVKRRIAELDGTTANPNVDINSTEAQAELAALRAELKKLGAERATIRVDAKELRDANKLRDISAKKQAAMSKAYIDEAKSAERAAKVKETAAVNEQKQIRQLAAMQTRAAAEDSRRTEESLKDVERLARARRDYGKVLGDVQRIEKKTGRPGGIFRTGGETRELEALRAKASGLAREVEHLGGTIEDIDPDLERNQGLLGRWGHSISTVRVQMGFFSATLAQLGKGVIALGPIITGLGGGLISVVGVLGSGIAGAGAVGAAGLAGFIGAAIGTVAVVKPMVKEFEEAHKASENLTKAQKEYGKGSTQAKTAQEKFNHIMAGTSPAAKAAIKDYGNITSQWKSLTSAAKPAVFNAFGAGIRTVQALLPDFAKQSVATTKTAGHAWEGWMDSLRSPEAKHLLNTVLSNFRASIPGVADGLASLGAAFGRIMASASKSLPSLSKGFSNWADSIEKSVGGGDALDKKIHNMVDNMKDLGHLSQDTGSFLVHLFGASSDAGDGLVNSLDRVIKKWDAWTQSAQGQDSLKNFFGEAREETEQFFSALSPLTRLLFSMSRAFAPITSGALKVVNVIGDVVQGLSQLPGLKTGLEGVGAVLAGMWAVGKVRLFAGAIGDAAGALRGLFAAQAASGGASALLGGAGGAKAATTIRREGEAIIGVGTAASASGAEVSAFSALLAPEVLVPVAGLAALVLLSTNLEGPKSAFEEAGEAAQAAHKKFKTSIDGFVKDSTEYNSTVRKSVSVNQEAKSAREALVKAQEKYGPASKEALKQLSRLSAAEEKQTVTAYKGARQRADQVNEARAVVSAAHAEEQALERRIHAAKEANQQIAAGDASTTSFGNPKEAEQVAFAVHKLTIARQQAAAAAAQMVVANIPLMRQQKELAPLTEQNVGALRKLSTTIGAAATKKIGSFVNPKDIADITKLGNKLTSLGRGSQVKKIAVSSSGAEQTEAKLKRLQRQTAQVEGARATVKVSANDTGAQRTLKAVSRESQRIAGTRATVRILADSANAEQAIARLRGHLMAVINHQYKAELTAEDKSGAAASAFHHNLQRPATQKYEAKLTAVDNATNIAKKAESSGKTAANGRYQLKITGVNQTSAAVNAAIAEINGISGRVHPAPVIVPVQLGPLPAAPTIKAHVTRFAGGPATYAYAAGGIPNDREIARAAQVAERRAGGTGGIMRKPTMLVGEQAPIYNEYVITENPAFRSSNERYLEQAASSIGREVIPAYKKGKGDGGKGNKSKGGKNDGPSVPDGGIKDPGPPPKLNGHVRKYREPTEVNNGKGIGQFNSLTKDAELEEAKYQNELAKEEREIAVYKKTGNGRSKWDFDLFKKIRQAILGDDRKIKQEAIPQEIKDVFAVQKKASGIWATANGQWETAKEKMSQGHRRLHKMENSYNHMHRDEKHENAKEYSDKRLKFKAEIEAQKAENDKWKARKEELEDRKKEARKTELAAKKEIKDLKGSATREAGNAIDEQENELATLEAYESGELDTPYAEADETKTPAEVAAEAKEKQEETENNEREGLEARIVEQEIAGPSHTQQLKEARENLLNWDYGALARAQVTPENRDDLEALNNIKSDKESLEGDAAGGTGKSAAEETATLSSARQALYEQFASNITTGNPAGPTPTGGYSAAGFDALPIYTQTAIKDIAASHTNGGGLSGPGPSPVGGNSGTVMNVTNNFSTPPPDPHTFSKNLTFELNAA